MSTVPQNRSWTLRLRERAVAALPPEKLLADKQPTYVASWIYVFGVLSIASLVSIILSGSILALKGPTWWHVSSIGRFFNSTHLWSVELFFFFMVIHLWGKYWMAAWRGGRGGTWVTGAVTFLVAIPCALTGYVSQQNFDAQWISTQAKDAMNSVGIGAFFNLLDFGQMYSYHILLLPVAVVVLVVAHVLLVRKHGVVPPFELQLAAATATEAGAAAAGAAQAPEEPAAAEPAAVDSAETSAVAGEGGSAAGDAESAAGDAGSAAGDGGSAARDAGSAEGDRAAEPSADEGQTA